MKEKGNGTSLRSSKKGWIGRELRLDSHTVHKCCQILRHAMQVEAKLGHAEIPSNNNFQNQPNESRETIHSPTGYTNYPNKSASNNHWCSQLRQKQNKISLTISLDVSNQNKQSKWHNSP